MNIFRLLFPHGFCRNAMAIWQDLVDQHGFPGRYASVRRFVITLRGPRTPEAHPIIVTAPGEEGQVDYGQGPIVRHPVTRKYRRTRLFVFTLGYSRKSVRLLTFESSARRWAELHASETYRGIPSSASTPSTEEACSITRERGTTLVLGAALPLAGFGPSTTRRFSGVDRGSGCRGVVDHLAGDRVAAEGP